MSRYAPWRCQQCGDAIGYLGRALEWLFGTMHKCRLEGVAAPAGETHQPGDTDA